MSQKTELQSNNTDLQTILSKVNGLPSGSALGDATAADVLPGKTFSSASGIKVQGAYNPPAPDLIDCGKLYPMPYTMSTSAYSGTISIDQKGDAVSTIPAGKWYLLKYQGTLVGFGIRSGGTFSYVQNGYIASYTNIAFNQIDFYEIPN